MNHQFSYWEKDSFLQPYDLIVVGAGIVGLSTTFFFLKSHPQARVLVLDKGLLPEGASTRNAGFACVGSIGEHLADLGKSSRDQVGKRIKMRYEGLKLLRSTLGEEGIQYEACGGYELFTDTEKFRKAEEHIPGFNKWIAELTGEREVYRPVRLNGYPAIHNRLEGALHPGRMMRSLARAVTGLGAEIRWNSPVESVEAKGKVILREGLSLESNQVLIAVNGFARRLLPDITVEPARGYVFVTHPLSDLDWKGTFHHDRGYVYFRNVGSRLLLGGARNVDARGESTDAFGSNPAIKEHLIAFADEVLRLERGWKIEHEWSGIMGFTETKTPVIQRLDETRTVAAGLSGMGIAIGMEVGKRAEALLNNKRQSSNNKQ